MLGQPLDWIVLHNRADEITLDEAREQVEQDLPSLSDLYVLGLIHLNRGEPSEARDKFQRILAVDPDNRQARWGMAEVARRGHDYVGSRQTLEEIISHDPGFAPDLISLAYLEYINQDFKKAAEVSARVINLGRDKVDQSNYLRAHGLYAAAKGMIAHYGGLFSKAVNGAAVLRHLNIIRRIAPGSPIVNFGLGSYYLLIPPLFGRDLDKARHFLERTIAADPRFSDPYVRLAQVYRLKGNQTKYRELVEKALGLDPKNELALDVKNRTCRFICFDDGTE